MEEAPRIHNNVLHPLSVVLFFLRFYRMFFFCRTPVSMFSLVGKYLYFEFLRRILFNRLHAFYLLFLTGILKPYK